MSVKGRGRHRMYTKKERRIWKFAEKMQVVVKTKRGRDTCEETVMWVKPGAFYDSWSEDDYHVSLDGLTRDQVKAIRKIVKD